MLVKTCCARCQDALMLNEDHVGCLVRCPKCKHTFTAKLLEPGADEPVELTLDVIDVEPIPAEEVRPVDLQREPTPAPRPRPVEPLRAPLRRPVARRRHTACFRFPVRVLDDSRGELEGDIDAVTNGDGLELREGHHLLLSVPVGTPAMHVSENEVEVQLDGRRVRLEVTKHGYGQRLAHELTGFLNEKRGPLDPAHYRRMSRALLAALIAVPVAAVTAAGTSILIRA